MNWQRFFCLAASIACASSAWAAAGDEFQGHWLTAASDAVIDFAPCSEKPDALCGTIVWDKDAGTSADTCGVRIAQLNKFVSDSWRDGWVYDPRTQKKYQGVLRIQGEHLRIRAFVGVEMLGQTELLRKVSSLPSSPVCTH